jgi:hypothetical protein
MCSRSTVKLPASVWCSGAGIAPASPAIKGGVVQSDNPQSASLSGNGWHSTVELAATWLKVGVGGESCSLVSFPFDASRIGGSSAPRRMESESWESLP